MVEYINWFTLELTHFHLRFTGVDWEIPWSKVADNVASKGVTLDCPNSTPDSTETFGHTGEDVFAYPFSNGSLKHGKGNRKTHR